MPGSVIAKAIYNEVSFFNSSLFRYCCWLWYHIGSWLHALILILVCSLHPLHFILDTCTPCRLQQQLPCAKYPALVIPTTLPTFLPLKKKSRTTLSASFLPVSFSLPSSLPGPLSFWFLNVSEGNEWDSWLAVPLSNHQLQEHQHPPGVDPKWHEVSSSWQLLFSSYFLYFSSPMDWRTYAIPSLLLFNHPR